MTQPAARLCKRNHNQQWLRCPLCSLPNFSQIWDTTSRCRCHSVVWTIVQSWQVIRSKWGCLWISPHEELLCKAKKLSKACFNLMIGEHCMDKSLWLPKKISFQICSPFYDKITITFLEILKHGWWGFVFSQPQEHYGNQTLMLNEEAWAAEGVPGPSQRCSVKLRSDFCANHLNSLTPTMPNHLHGARFVRRDIVILDFQWREIVILQHVKSS